jgi:hypothetical protein
MGLLKPAANQTAAAKLGLYGEAGSGKTRTATEIALGLAKLTGVPIAFFDTEGGSDFMVKLCKVAGVELLVAKARAFADLMAFMKEARAANAVAIVDSISHTWDDLRESYERKLKRKSGLEIWDWGIIKPAWREFTTEFLTSPIHVIVCGRAASIYEQVYNADRGKTEVQVVGTKMKTEKETAYEPSLLIEMERVERRGEPGYDHVAHVQKDRSDVMDGQSFPNPTFETFLPFFEQLNLGGEHKPTDATRTSDHMFDTPDNAIERKHQVEITLEKIKDAFVLADIGAASKDDKKRMKELLFQSFGTTAWSEIEGMRLEALKDGLALLRRHLGQGDPVSGEADDLPVVVAPFSMDDIDEYRVLINDGVAAGVVTKDEAKTYLSAAVGARWDVTHQARHEVAQRLKEHATVQAALAAEANGAPKPKKGKAKKVAEPQPEAEQAEPEDMFAPSQAGA